MKKHIQDCIEFSNQNPVCYLATTDGDQPRVRALGFWFADKTGFYFQTSSNKEFTQQLKKNPKTDSTRNSQTYITLIICTLSDFCIYKSYNNLYLLQIIISYKREENRNFKMGWGRF